MANETTTHGHHVGERLTFARDVAGRLILAPCAARWRLAQDARPRRWTVLWTPPPRGVLPKDSFVLVRGSPLVEGVAQLRTYRNDNEMQRLAEAYNDVWAEPVQCRAPSAHAWWGTACRHEIGLAQRRGPVEWRRPSSTQRHHVSANPPSSVRLAPAKRAPKAAINCPTERGTPRPSLGWLLPGECNSNLGPRCP